MSAVPGVKQEVRDKVRAPLADPGRGKHLWTVFAMYQVTTPAAMVDPTAQILLDRENLLTIEGPGCFKCEKTWTPDVERRFCQGVMT